MIGILDWGTSWFAHWSRFIAGGLLASLGYFFIKWSSRLLDRGDQSQSLGLEGPLHTEGPYLYTRNPQYIGYILFLTGIVLITNSFMALAIGILAILWLFLAPFSEEPWLHEQFGKEYGEYRKRVPRWIGRASFKRRSSSARRPR
ncbi:MAG: hypothetical protein GTO55_06010 [Armatimonadetes bacterium]|nr:hypothetical protein [Armatimonadota bacterium]NIN05888.1 hypothetical protein [Armatimonadota bacterium]